MAGNVVVIEYSGGIRPQKTTTQYERQYGQITQAGQKISSGAITFPNTPEGRERANLFQREMRYMGYGVLQRRYFMVEKEGQLQATKLQKTIQERKGTEENIREQEELKTYFISGKPVLKAEYESRKLEAQQRAGTQWQSQKVVTPRYYVAQETKGGKIETMRVTPELYKKYTANVEKEGKKYQTFETSKGTGYSGTGKISVRGVATKEPKTGLLGTWEKVEEKSRAFTRSFLPKTEKIFTPYEEKRATEIKAFNLPYSDIYGYGENIFPTNLLEDSKAFTYGYAKGIYKDIREEPALFVGRTALWYGLGWGLKGIAWGLGKAGAVAMKFKPVARVFSKLSKIPTEKLLAGAVIGAYGGSIAYRVGKEPTWEKKGEKAGEITYREIAPLVTGGWLYAKTEPKITGFFRGLGKKTLPAESLIRPEVLLGKKRFPTAGVKTTGKGKIDVQLAKTQLKEFYKQKYKLPEEWFYLRNEKELLGGYHATPYGKFKVAGKGSSEVSGLYISSEVSPHFLKVTKEYQPIGLSLLPKGGSPTILRIYPQSFKLPPSGVTTSLGMTEYLSLPKTYGSAYTLGLKTEIEAVIPTGTLLREVQTKYALSYKGIKLPIVQAFAVPSTAPISTKGLLTAGQLYSKYYYSSIYTTPALSYAPLISFKTTPSSYFKDISSYAKAFSSGKVSYPSSISPVSKVSKGSTSRSSSISSSSLSSLSSISKSLISGSSITRTPRTPRYIYYPSIIKTPTIPPIPPFILKERKQRVKKGIKAKPKGLYYQAGFTSKTLGLAKVVSSKELERMAKKVYSNLELRPIAIVRNKKPRGRRKK